MTEKELTVLREEIARGIQLNVNGKIDSLKKTLDEHVKVCLPAIEQRDNDMARILPVIEAYEAAKGDLKAAKKGGKAILWLSATITGIGGAILVLRSLFFGH